MNAPSLCARAITQSTPVLMQMVVKQQHLTLLRQAIRHICRVDVEILFLKPCQDAAVKVCFLVSQHLLDAVMDNIMRVLPAAQFGRYYDLTEQLQSALEKDYTVHDQSTIWHAHTCPVCQRIHQVNDAMHALAYGKPYTCSLACELKRRQHWWHFAPQKPEEVS